MSEATVSVAVTRAASAGSLAALLLVDPGEATPGIEVPAAVRDRCAGRPAGHVVTTVVDGSLVLVVGGGPAASFGAVAARAVARSIAREAPGATVALHGLAGRGPDAVGAFADEALGAAYRFERYRTGTPRDAAVARVEIVAPGGAQPDPAEVAAVEAAVATAPARSLARDLVNEPPSRMTPRAFAEVARTVAAAAGLEVEVFDETDLADAGCGAILGIGRGSDEPPRLVSLSTRTPDPVARVALVGKGITFDAGGLFIKKPEGMGAMKGDMAGAAAILGALSVAASIAPRVSVTAWLALAENLPGPSAIKPGDVVTARNGRTIEVNDPDAEGRVVLADALSMAAEGRPDAIVDIATLTSAKQQAVGNALGALYATDDTLAERLVLAGAAASEPLWRMPIVEAYRRHVDSAVADLKVYDPIPNCPDSILGALFLREFVPAGTPWAHLDIAGCEFADRDGPVPEGMATGFGAGLLVELLRGWDRSAERRPGG